MERVYHMLMSCIDRQQDDISVYTTCYLIGV